MRRTKEILRLRFESALGLRQIAAACLSVCSVPRFALARADGSFRHLLARISRIDVLVVDDWAMAPLTGTRTT